MNHGRSVKHHNRENDADDNTQSLGSPTTHELVHRVQKRTTSTVNQEDCWIPMLARARLTHIFKDAPVYTRGVHNHVVILVKSNQGSNYHNTTYALPERFLWAF